MHGEYKIRVKNNRNSYSFTLKRNFTILRGDSGRGKTTLYEMISEYNRYGKESGVFVSSDRELMTVSGDGWQDIIEANPNKILVIDEDNSFIRTKEFARVVKNSDNYFLLITRNYLADLPVSVDEIYKLTGGKNNKFVPMYGHIDRMFDKPLKEYLPFKPEVIITEDSNSGYQYFKSLADEYGIDCVSAYGKSNIIKKLNEYTNKNVVVIADGAALGAEIEGLVNQQILRPRKIALFLPESFEWLVLKSGIVDVKEEMIEHPEDFADSTAYMSWEQYFSDVLIKATSDKEYMSYTKKSLKAFYYQGKGKDAIKNLINGIDFN